MKIIKAFKFQLKTNEAQQTKMRNFAGSCPFVWNKTLAVQKERLNNGQSRANYSKAAAELVDWERREETQFLKEIHSQNR